MSRIKKRTKILIFLAVATTVVVFIIYSLHSIHMLDSEYLSRRSPMLLDRRGTILAIKTNAEGYYAVYSPTPKQFADLLVKNEDRWFYYHRGINPISIARALWRRFTGKGNPASSTITQQLAKILLKNENERTIPNKLQETLVTLELELFYTKKEILNRYVNSVFFGNRAQGLEAASQLYFNKSGDSLSVNETAELLATIKNPSTGHPFSEKNIESAASLAKRLKLKNVEFEPLTISRVEERKANFHNYVANDNSFEAGSLVPECAGTCNFFIDSELTTKLRNIVSRRLQGMSGKNVTAGAIAVIKLPENELLALVGSPNPSDTANGHKLNMALVPRAIGSTVKPLIYGKAFERGLRPYSLVDDQEYRYEVANGFPLYPKNFDREYHGRLTLHYALDNSLNVPTVKTLEFLGLDNFFDFLEKDLSFKPVQPLRHYALGIALGELEMNLVQLAHYMTLFANHGYVRPLMQGADTTVAGTSASTTRAIGGEYVQLVNKVLSDRATGVDQFGLISPLNLPWRNYAVKTGTSRDFHDSWTVGYTPDFLVAVWVGNSDESPMDGVSGIVGAGNIWHDAMSLMYNSDYNRNTPFDFSALKEFSTDNGTDFGLEGDVYTKHVNLLISDELITNPHQDDAFLYEKTTQIPLKSIEDVFWSVNNVAIGHGQEVLFHPPKAGTYTVTAQSKSGKTESVVILVNPNR